MNLDMIRPRNDTEDLILSRSENCEMLIEQIHGKAAESFKLKLTQARETFFPNHQSQLRDVGWKNYQVWR